MARGSRAGAPGLVPQDGADGHDALAMLGGADVDGDYVTVLAGCGDGLDLAGADGGLRVGVQDGPGVADPVGEDALEVTRLGVVGHGRVAEGPAGLGGDRGPRPVGAVRPGPAEHDLQHVSAGYRDHRAASVAGELAG